MSEYTDSRYSEHNEFVTSTSTLGASGVSFNEVNMNIPEIDLDEEMMCEAMKILSNSPENRSNNKRSTGKEYFGFQAKIKIPDGSAGYCEGHLDLKESHREENYHGGFTDSSKTDHLYDLSS